MSQVADKFLLGMGFGITAIPLDISSMHCFSYKVFFVFTGFFILLVVKGQSNF